MFVFHRAPLLRLLLPLVAGMLVSVLTGWIIPAILSLFLIGGAIVFLWITTRHPFVTLRFPGIEGIPVYFALFVFGFSWASLKNTEQDVSHFSKYLKNPEVFLMQVDEKPVPKTKSIKTIVQVKAVKENNKWIPVSGKLLCYLGPENGTMPVYGQLLLVKGIPEPVKGPMNPGEFDYRKYLAIHGIGYQLYAGPLFWQPTATFNQGNVLKAMAIAWRTRLLQTLREAGLSGENFGVTAALVLGDDDHIDPGLMHAYASSGTLHVLSVSGLHVAIVYLVFNGLFGFFNRIKNGVYYKAVLLILILWLYALVTGMSPSVLRSAAMLSFVIAGTCMRQRPHILNTLAASALILLLIDPYLLFDVGFQLSYTAVAGIVLIEPYIREQYEPRNWLTRHLWGLTAVSLAAQIATFPLGFYYFQQFPTYFLLANMIVIPLSTVVMYAGMLLLVFAAVPYISDVLVGLLQASLFLLNGSVKLTETLPGAVLQTGKIGLSQLICIYMLTGGLFLFWINKHLRWLQLAAVSGIILFVLLIFRQHHQATQQQLLIYSIPKSAGLGLIHGHEAVLFGDSLIYNQKNLIEFHIQPHLMNCGIKNTEQFSMQDDTLIDSPLLHRCRNWLRLGDKTVVLAGDQLFIPDSLAHKSTAGINQPDILIVNKLCRLKPELVLAYYNPLQVVVDGTVSRKRSAVWQTACNKAHRAFHDVKEKGAFEINW